MSDARKTITDRGVLFWIGASEQNEGRLVAGYIVSPAELAAVEELDPRRFGAAIREAGVDWSLGDIGKVLTAYNRALNASGDER